MAYSSQSDLEIALGSAAVLVQLADPNGTGTADFSIVTDYLESGAALVRSVVEVRHEPETIANLDADSQRLLRDCNKWLSARIAWIEGGQGQTCPERVEQMADKMETVIDQIRTGERRLGRASGGTAAALGQAVGVLSYDPDASRVSIAGFKLGYR